MELKSRTWIFHLFEFSVEGCNWPHRLTVRTADSQSANRSSILREVIQKAQSDDRAFCFSPLMIYFPCITRANVNRRYL